MKTMVMWMVCLLLMVYAPAQAEYQEEFELSCSRKTDAAALVFHSCEEDGAVIDRIPYGTYVHVLNRGLGDWVEIIYMVNGIQHHGWTEAPLVRCVTTVLDRQGQMTEVHELDEDYFEKVSQARQVLEENELAE